MSQPPPPPNNSYTPGYAPPDKDAEHLKTLSIFWYVLSGLQCIGLCVGLGYTVFGIIAFTSGMGPRNHGDPPPAVFGGIFGCAGLFMLALFITTSLLAFNVAKSLVARRRHTLCFVVACIVCMSVPLGTILGVFTLMVLSRPSVKASFT